MSRVVPRGGDRYRPGPPGKKSRGAVDVTTMRYQTRVLDADGNLEFSCYSNYRADHDAKLDAWEARDRIKAPDASTFTINHERAENENS